MDRFAQIAGAFSSDCTIQSFDKGLYLEKAKVLLAWDTPFEALPSLGHVMVYEHHETSNFCWENEIVFGGLPVNINLQGVLGIKTLFLERASALFDAVEEYPQLLDTLTGRLGSPHYFDSSEGCPRARWIWDDVSIGVRRSEHYVACVITQQSQ